MPLNCMCGVVLVAKWNVHLDLTAVARLRCWSAEWKVKLDIHGRGNQIRLSLYKPCDG